MQKTKIKFLNEGFTVFEDPLKMGRKHGIMNSTKLNSSI